MIAFVAFDHVIAQADALKFIEVANDAKSHAEVGKLLRDFAQQAGTEIKELRGNIFFVNNYSVVTLIIQISCDISSVFNEVRMNPSAANSAMRILPLVCSIMSIFYRMNSSSHMSTIFLSP